MGLTATIHAGIKAVQTGTNDFGGPAYTPAIEALLSFTDGTGQGQADILWADIRTVSSASNDDLDFAGVLSSAFGATIAAAELVALVIINAPASGAANTTTLTLGQGSTNPVLLFGGTSPTKTIKPGGVLLLADTDATGLATVSAGSADTLRIANGSGASATYQIAVLARSA